MKWAIGVICVLGVCFCGAMWAWGDGGVTAAPRPEPAANSDDRPAVECGGIAAKGQRVVYVIDHRGEKLDGLESLCAGLKQSINGLDAEQTFAVVVFAEEAKVLGATDLRVATDESKVDVAQRIDQLKPAEAQNQMLPPYQSAFEKAFTLKPDVIYFLTDDTMIDSKTRDAIKAVNKDRSVCINVLAIAQADHQSQEFALLAKDNGGQSKVLTVEEFKLALAKAAAPPADDAPPAPVKFFGVEGKANRIVYVIDHSGSLLDNFDFLREEIKRSVGALGSTQSFAVVTFAEDVDADSPAALARATTENKRALDKHIDNVKSQGQNDDMLPPFQHAFNRAFALKPQVIFFLTDGHFDPKLLDIVKELNKYQKVQISTFAFVQEEPDYKIQMQDMAKDNGGTYKFVAEKDLGK